jgi:hypothetical protein
MTHYFGQSVKLPSDNQAIESETLSLNIDTPNYQPDPFEVRKIQHRFKSLGFSYSEADIINMILKHRVSK